MPKKDDVEQKVMWYQKLTPVLQKHMLDSMARGTRVIEDRMGKLLKAFQKDGGFSTPTDAWKWLKETKPTDISDLEHQLQTVKDPEFKKYISEQINMEVHRFAYTREKYLADTIKIQNKRMAEDLKVRGEGTVGNVAKMGYLYKNYEISKATKVGFSIGGFPEGLVSTLASSTLDDTKTIGYFDTVSQGMKDELMKGLTSGMSNEQIARAVHSQMSDRELWVSRAFARTSVCEVSAQAEKKAMEENGIKKYTYRCTLDEVTCPVCGNLDGRSFRVEDAKAGFNYPPMHRNCRCTEVPFLTKEASEGLKRRARDENGRTMTVDRDMTYRDWAEKYAPKSAGKLPSIEPMPGEQFHTPKVEPPKVTPKKPRDKFTQKEKNAVENYVSGNGMYINRYLREGAKLSEEDQMYVKTMDKAISKAKVDEDVLYRSVDAEAIFGKMSDADFEHLQRKIVYNDWDAPKSKTAELERRFGNINGKVVTEKGYMSTTKDREIAKDFKDFTGSTKPVVLRFTNAKGKNGFPVEKYFEKKGSEQKEVLLGRGMNYKVTKVYAEDGNIMVDCEFTDEVEQPLPPVEEPKIEKPKNKGIVEDEFHPKTVAGVVRTQESMTVEEADHRRANPNNILLRVVTLHGDTLTLAPEDKHLWSVYKSTKKYRINCQTCVVSYEARRRGYDVIAKGNTKRKTNKSYQLSMATNKAWIDPKTGEVPPIQRFGVSGIGSQHFDSSYTTEELVSWMEDTVKPGQRYSFEYCHKFGDGGHIISCDRNEDGVLRLIDPQVGEIYEGDKLVEYCKTYPKINTYVDSDRPGLLRVDDKCFNPEYVDDILEKGDTKDKVVPQDRFDLTRNEGITWNKEDNKNERWL